MSKHLLENSDLILHNEARKDKGESGKKEIEIVLPSITPTQKSITRFTRGWSEIFMTVGTTYRPQLTIR